MSGPAMMLAAAVGIALIVALASAIGIRRKRRRLLRMLRAEWGEVGPVKGLDDYGENELWLELERDGPNLDAMDSRTWSDLDLDRVLGTLDRTRSGLGRQLFYRRLRSGRRWTDSPILEPLAGRFAAEPQLRDEVGMRLERAGRRLGPGLWIITRPGLIQAPAWYWIFPVLAAVMFVSLVAIPFELRALLVAVPLAVVNMTICAVTASRTAWLLAPIRQLGAMFRTARQLSRIAGGSLPGAMAVAEDLRQLGRLKAVTWWVSRDPATAGELLVALWEYLNLMFVLDANALLASARELRHHADRVARVATWIGEVDLARSVASLRAEPRGWCIPGAACPTTSGTGIWHPLVLDPIPNDVQLCPGRGILITGANMAGKSTYLRAVGIASVLARTIHTCPAQTWEGAGYHVRSLMGPTDDLAAGKSYYQVEVDAVVAHLTESMDDEPTLFLLDELLRGTNTVERLAAGEAVLAALLAPGARKTSPHTVVVATHDGELVRFLRGSYDPWHFRETITAEGLDFDYIRRPGPATTRTAIALLEASGAPPSVVKTARARAEEIEATDPGS